MAVLVPATPADRGETFLTWLKRHGQTEQAIERFWKTILVSALNEDVDEVSVSYAAQVIRESFLKSAAAGRMGVPTVPLTQLYSAAGDAIRSGGGEVQFRTGVESFRAQASEVTVVVNGQEQKFDYLVLAVSFDVLAKMLPDSPAAAPLAELLSHFTTSPITGIHLWFDREISDLDHAVLLDRTIQWMFHKSRLLKATEHKTTENGRGSYVELVVSNSRSLVEKSRGEIVELAVRELGEFFPAVREAKLVKSTVIKEVHATYSPRPGVDQYRPRPETAWPRVFLAGDFVATGWPATMEGAVRSGYLAAESLARVSGNRDAKFLVPNLPGSGFMRSAS
jgi:zeta-carotene desaturase